MNKDKLLRFLKNEIVRLNDKKKFLEQLHYEEDQVGEIHHIILYLQDFIKDIERGTFDNE